MKILLLGKNGQLGKELEGQIKEKNTVIAFGREELDITDVATLSKQFKKYSPDIVINASAYHVVPDCEAYPEKAFAINATAIKQLAELAEMHNSRLVHYSTDYVFDGLQGRPYIEDSKPHPLQMYGISKLAGEFAALTYSQKSIVIRSAYIYGGETGSRAKKGNFVLSILKQAEGKKNLEVSSDQIVSPTYAADLAKATVQLLKQKDARGIYHLVNKGYCTLAEFAQKIVTGKKFNTTIIPVERGGVTQSLRRPLFSALRNTRAKQLGIVLPTWQDGLRRYLATL